SFAALREIAFIRFSSLSHQDAKLAKISSSLQTVFLNPIDDLDSPCEPNIRKRLGVLDRLIINFPSGRKRHLAVHRQSQHFRIFCRLFVEQIEFILKRIKDVPSSDAS